MGSPFDSTSVDQIVSQIQEYFLHNVLFWDMVVQIVVIGCALLLAHKASGERPPLGYLAAVPGPWH
jgi:hypothetical protein